MPYILESINGKTINKPINATSIMKAAQKTFHLKGCLIKNK